jgi:ribosomal protein S18 acetylase RimI-like enzyme
MPGKTSVTVRILEAADTRVLDTVALGVFDGPVDAVLLREFLADSRHHLAVALSEADVVVGMASGVHYVHPDKRAQMFINEVGVAPSDRGRGTGRRLVAALIERARSLGCSEAWVLTESSNEAAMAMYRAAGGQASPTASVMFTFPLASSVRAGSPPATSDS